MKHDTLRRMRNENMRGKQTDEILLKMINEYEGLSQYELARKLRWKSGHIDGSVRRLLNSNKIFLRIVEKNGRKANLVYSKEHMLSNSIEIPTGLLTIGNPTWNTQAYFYALDNSTIGISGEEMDEWKEVSCFMDEVPIRRVEGKIYLQIPDRFSRFYNLQAKHRVVSVSGNNLLVTVSGDIIEEKNYPS